MEIVSVSVYFKVLSLDKVSSRQIWNIEQKKKNREKEKVGGRPVKLKEKKGDGFRARDKKQGRHFFVGGTT